MLKQLVFKVFKISCFYSLSLVVKITRVPSDASITLQANETVLLQFHVQGVIAGVPRSTVRFSGEGQQLFCTGTSNYVFQFDSKPLVKDLSVTCDQAYWLNTDQHRQKYEVRITNGDAARNIDRITVGLEVSYFHGAVLGGQREEFEIIMMTDAATPTPDSTTSTAPVTQGSISSTTTPSSQDTSVPKDTQTITH